MDIIFFAAVACYIFFKLHQQLGKVDEEELKQIRQKIAAKQSEIVAAQNQIKTVQPLELKEKNPANEEIINSLDSSNRANLIEILEKCKIDADFFLKGAKYAFDLIIKAFSQGDLINLKLLLADKIYQDFEAAINQRKSQEKILITNIIALEKAEIVAASLFENNATISVKFISKQINYVVNKEGNIIDGKKDEINQLTDIWVFKKDLLSSNPNWLVSATNS